MRYFIVFILVVVVVSSSLAQDSASPNIADIRARADAGDAKAQVALARAYQDGKGVPQSDTRAFDWFMKAAQAGDVEAENAVAYTYRSEHNFTEALKWYGLAAKQGSSNAMFNLGTLYYNGDGIRVDDTEAYAWFWLAKRAGSKAATEAVTRSETDMPPGKVNDARLRIADMLAEGKDVPRDTLTALAVYEDAGRYGKPEVQIRLAKIFLNGWDVPDDAAKGEMYCRKALDTEKDYTPAMLCLGFVYQSGKLGTGHEQDAVNWYEKAYKASDPLAAYGLGVAYATGKGVKQDLEKAFTYLVIASLSNIEVATPLAKQVEQKLSPETAKKIIKKANQEKKTRAIYSFGTVDREFAYAVKIDRLP